MVLSGNPGHDRVQLQDLLPRLTDQGEIQQLGMRKPGVWRKQHGMPLISDETFS